METIPTNMQIAITIVIAAASVGFVLYTLVYDRHLKSLAKKL